MIRREHNAECQAGNPKTHRHHVCCHGVSVCGNLCLKGFCRCDRTGEHVIGLICGLDAVDFVCTVCQRRAKCFCTVREIIQAVAQGDRTVCQLCSAVLNLSGTICQLCSAIQQRAVVCSQLCSTVCQLRRAALKLRYSICQCGYAVCQRLCTVME